MPDAALLLALAVGATLAAMDITRQYHAWRARARRMIEASGRSPTHTGDATSLPTIITASAGLAALVGGFVGLLVELSATSGLVAAVGLAIAYVVLRNAAARYAQRVEEAALGGPPAPSLRYALAGGAAGTCAGAGLVLAALWTLTR